MPDTSVNAIPVIDAHCHPALKYYLFEKGQRIFEAATGKPDDNYTNNQVTIPAMKSGNVTVVMSAHYLPEKYIVSDWSVVRRIPPLLKEKIKKYFEKVEKEDTAFEQTLKMIYDFGKLFQNNKDVLLIKKYDDLEICIKEGKKGIIQTLEGAHHLGRGKTIEEYKKRIDTFKEEGIAMITLSHFYPNDFTSPTEGLTPLVKLALGMKYPPQSSVPMNEKGIAIVNYLLEKGILIDLTHTNRGARQQIFQINRQRGDKQMPIVFSHSGVEHNFHDVLFPSFGEITVTDWEIQEIKDCKGVIGIIFMNYWLTGKDEWLPGSDWGFENIFKTITHIHHITNSFDNIAIGTDFDGMADPPDDYYETGMLKVFKQKLLSRIGELNGTLADVDAIMGGNIMRVLRASGF